MNGNLSNQVKKPCFLTKIEQFLSVNQCSTQKDQFFIIDPAVIQKLLEIAKIDKNDRVLEIGPGLGFLTMELAAQAKDVIAMEVDEKFKPYLSNLPENVEVIYGDAYKLLNNKDFKKKALPPTKTVSNIPYSQAQNMLHNYTSSSWYQGNIIWLAPLSLAEKVNSEPILGAYFKAEVKEKVSKESFYPQPNTTSAIILFQRIPDPKQTKDLNIYLRRWFYDHENWKFKNILREGVIKVAYDLKNKRVTKKQAKDLISELKLPQNELEKLTYNIKPEYYFEIPKKLEKWFGNL